MMENYKHISGGPRTRVRCAVTPAETLAAVQEPPPGGPGAKPNARFGRLCKLEAHMCSDRGTHWQALDLQVTVVHGIPCGATLSRLRAAAVMVTAVGCDGAASTGNPARPGSEPGVGTVTARLWMRRRRREDLEPSA